MNFDDSLLAITMKYIFAQKRSQKKKKIQSPLCKHSTRKQFTLQNVQLILYCAYYI